MSTSSKGKISVETGQVLTAYAKMTDSGDHQIFSLGTIWSDKNGYEADVRPNGMVAGRNVLSIHASNDTITIAALTAYSKGTLLELGATTDTFTRGSGPGKAKIISVTLDCTGTLEIVPAGEGAGAAFSETRNAAGGPPYVPVSSIEIGQIRTTGSTAAPLVAAEILQVAGQHCERYDFPSWSEFPIGKGSNADSSAEQQSHIKLTEALDANHVAGTYKDVYVQYYTPQLTEIPKATDFVPAETSHSISSQQYYNGTVGSSGTSLNAGGFTAFLGDGVTDALLAEKDEVVTVKFWPDRNKAPYILSQGAMGVARAFPPAAQNSAGIVIASENESAAFIS